jgi:hypothetical protein
MGLARGIKAAGSALACRQWLLAVLIRPNLCTQQTAEKYAEGDSWMFQLADISSGYDVA